MALDLPFLSDHSQRQLSRQVSSLARDAGNISEHLARFSADARRDAGHLAHDLADEAWQQGAVAAKALGQQALRAGKALRRDPVPVAVAVVGLACFLSLVLASGRATRRRQ